MGKTEFCADLCWRLGNMIQGGQIYYFGAYQKSVREFLWAPGRLQNHGPREYIKEIHKTEMRQTFISETFVKLDGADEFRLSKGFNPDVVILDEFADYPEDFWPAMSPNFASKDAIVVIISSPPWVLENAPGEPVLFVRIADLWKQYMEEAVRQKKRTKYIYLNFPSSVNEKNLPPGFLAQEKAELTAMGLEDIWLREYEAKRVTGGGKRIIGTYAKEKHMVPHDWLIANKIERNRDVLQWCTGVDPSQSAFGVLHVAVNPYSKEVYFLDEILEKQDTETTEHLLWPRIKAKEDELYPEEGTEVDSERWDRVCDEAAKWWIIGCANDPEINANFSPTEKATHSIEFGLSLLRSIFRYDKAYLSDRCQWFGYYLENWRRDKRGNIPDTGKDLIDCLTGDTLVDTTKGQIPIEALVGKSGLLYSKDNLIRPFYDVRQTHRDVRVLRVSFEDGNAVTCTPNHQFLTSTGEWKRADCLSLRELIQCATNASRNNQREQAILQREGLYKIQREELLHSCDIGPTSYCMGAFQWAYSQGLGYSPHRRESRQQSDRKPTSDWQKRAYKSTLFSRETRMVSSEHGCKGGASSEILAFITGRQGLARRAWQICDEIAAIFRESLRVLREKVQNQKYMRKILSSELQNECSQTAVKGIEELGTTNTYCLQVKDTQAFSVNGGIIVHNCARYLLHRLGYYLTEEDRKSPMPLHPRERQRLQKSPDQELAEHADELFIREPFVLGRISGSDDEWMQ